MHIVGLMSGTSADAIDVALVEVTGAPPSLQAKVIKHLTVEYEPELHREIFACFRPESSSVDRLCRLNVSLGEAYAAAVLKVIEAARFVPQQVDLVASHGQTLWYDAPQDSSPGAVLTFGEPAVIAERTGITTISNFRSRDLAAGGYGAPLAGYLDWLLFRHPTQWRAIQNIGGIGNITLLPPLNSDAAPLTFDTGPGNMVMDYCANRATNGAQQFDRDGLIAAQGKVHEGLLGELMAHPYIAQKPPKTTGRELFGVQFGQQVWERGEALGLSPADIVRTATAFTARTIRVACHDWSQQPIDELYVAGGGALNPTLLQLLRAELAPAEIYTHDKLGLESTAKECVLFAVLGYEMWHRRHGTLPALTGASRPVVLGSITPGRL